MNFRKDEIIFLFGAGVSADAEIPISSQMIIDVEEKVITHPEWKKFKDLYNLIKSGVAFSAGIQGKEAIFNIEVLVNVLNELEKKESHPLYPFIGSWHIKFNEIIGNNFELLKEFRKKIIDQLKSWVNPHDIRNSSYLNKIEQLKKDINFPIRIFTLNYDKLIEKNLNNLKIERGFEEDSRQWNYKRFSELTEEPDIYLYKLHGSIDWQRDQNTQIVSYVDSIPEEPDLIFGTQYKMQYIDPYLFMMSEFRHYCLKTKLIVCIGYSFYDEHINAILSQSLKSDNNIILFALAFDNGDKKRIENLFNQNMNQIKIESNKRAKDFFENEFTLEKFSNLIANTYKEDIL